MREDSDDFINALVVRPFIHAQHAQNKRPLLFLCAPFQRHHAIDGSHGLAKDRAAEFPASAFNNTKPKPVPFGKVASVNQTFNAKPRIGTALVPADFDV